MGLSTIDTFKSKVSADFARSNLFKVFLNFPTEDKLINGKKVEAGDASDTAKFFCRAAQMPASTIGVIEVPVQGRTYKIPGDRTFEPWTITVMNDRNQALRRSFERWINLMNNAKRNRSNFKGLGYFANPQVHLLSRYAKGEEGDDGFTVKKYKFHHCYPSNISSMDLDANANDQIMEFTVEWQYAYWTVIEGDSPDGVTLPG